MPSSEFTNNTVHYPNVRHSNLSIWKELNEASP